MAKAVNIEKMLKPVAEKRRKMRRLDGTIRFMTYMLLYKIMVPLFFFFFLLFYAIKG